MIGENEIILPTLAAENLILTAVHPAHHRADEAKHTEIEAMARKNVMLRFFLIFFHFLLRFEFCTCAIFNARVLLC